METSLICFLHIEKAAGTTFHHILANNFKNYLTLSPAYYWSNEDGNYISAKELHWIMRLSLPTRAIGGHPVRGYLDYEKALGRPVKYIVFLREPISRYISHFKHQKYAKGISWDIHSFLSEKRFNDYMTRRLSPSNNLEEAKMVLKEKISFVGLTEFFDESLLFLRKNLSLTDFNISYEKENVGKEGVPNSEYLKDPEIYSQIIQNNRNDIELYKYAKEVIFKKYIDEYGPSQMQDTLMLRELNSSFVFSKKRKFLDKIYRVFYYKPLQYLVKVLFH